MNTNNIKLVEAVNNYAEVMGLGQNDPQVQKYAQALTQKMNSTSKVARQVDGSTNERLSLRYIRAVRRYAESQNLTVKDEQVKKYARGLLNIFKDFRERPAAIEELGLLADGAEFDEAPEILK